MASPITAFTEQTSNLKSEPMKKPVVSVLAACAAMLLLTGCLNLQVGGGPRGGLQAPTVGQQLVDLQKARESGAITDAEYQAQKTKFLAEK